MRRNIIIFGFTSFFADIAGEMLVPLLPVFFKSTLGLSVLLIGVIEGASDSIASFMRIVSGELSDFFKKRKIFVMIGYGIAALGKPLLAIANSFGGALGARLLDRSGKGVREPPRDALLAESIGREHRGGAFGFLKSFDTLGAVVGNLSAFLLIYLAFSIREIFWIAFVPALIAVVAVGFVKEARRGEERTEERVNVKIKDLIKFRGLFGRAFWKFIVVAAVFAFGKISYAFLILRAEVIMHNVALIPLLYLLYNIVFTLTAWPVGKLADRFGKKRFIFYGYILFALMSVGFIFAQTTLHFALLFVLYGLFFAFTEGNSRAFISNVAEGEHRATALGIYNAIEGFVFLPAGAIAGVLWVISDGVGTFVYSSILSLIAAMLLFILFFTRRQKRI